MDEKDNQIINLLQENGRLSYAEIGKSVDLSVSGVKQRIEKLIKTGVLSKNVFLVDPHMVGLDICAFVMVLIPEPSAEPNFISCMNDVPEILECHCITGEYSYLLKVRVQNTRQLERLIAEKVTSIKGVERTNTMIALTSSKEVTQFKIPSKD